MLCLEGSNARRCASPERLFWISFHIHARKKLPTRTFRVNSLYNLGEPWVRQRCFMAWRSISPNYWQNNFYSFRDLSNSRWPASPFHWRQRFRTRTPRDSDNLQYWTTYHESDESNPESLGLIRTHQLISISLGSNLTGSHPHLYLPADWFPLTIICWWFHSGVEEFL